MPKVYQELYDESQYKKSFLSNICFLKHGNIDDDVIVYLIKNKVAENGFDFPNQHIIKNLIFLYFYTLGRVDFSNNYSIIFKKEQLPLISLTNILRIGDRGLTNFKQYFDLGKNILFLNKIYDESTNEQDSQVRKDAYKVDNIVDFFIVFLIENFELYSLEGQHFPLFKWLICELHEHYEGQV